MERIIELNIKDKGVLDLNTKGFAIPLVYNINDIKEIGTRRVNFSKTIKVVGSKNNNEIFNHLYEIRGINFDYKLRNKYNCSLLVNKIPIFDGFIQLKKITKVLINSTYEIVYEINLFDSVKNLFDDFGGEFLNDLSFEFDYNYHNNYYAAGDHPAYDSIIGGSFNSLKDYTDVYNYPIVDFGFNEGIEGKYPYSYKLPSGSVYPSVYLKAVFDRIFHGSDFDYKSDFIDGVSYDGMYKDLAYIYNKQENYYNLKVGAAVFGDEVFEVGGYIPPGSDVNELLLNNYYDKKYMSLLDSSFVEIDGFTFNGVDPSNVLGLKNIDDEIGNIYMYIIKENGMYDINYNFEISNEQITIPPPCSLVISEDNVEYMTEVGIDKLNNIKIDEEGDVSYDVETLVSYSLSPGGDAGITSSVIRNVELKEGDLLSYYVHRGSSIRRIICGSTAGWSMLGKLPNIQCYTDLVFKRDELIDEDTGDDILKNVKINEILPNLSKGDFLRNHIKMFNMYFYADKIDANLIYIEPRDVFYQDGVTINWTNKVDYNKEIVIEPIDDDGVAKTILLTHELGSDYYSTLHNDNYGEVYGEYKETVDGNIQSSEYESSSYNQSYILKDNMFNIIKLCDDLGDNWYDTKRALSPMVCFMDYRPTSLRMSGYNSIDEYNITVDNYVFATHAKLIGGNSYDLNYKTSNQDFTLSNYDPERGLYNIFWAEYMNNLINEDARKVTLYVDLDINDIINLDFKNKISIKGQVYILEKLEYDPSNDDSSKITLIKDILNTPGSFNPEDLMLLNDLGEFITSDDIDGKIIIG